MPVDVNEAEATELRAQAVRNEREVQRKRELERDQKPGQNGAESARWGLF